MAKFHLNYKGEPGVCKARKNCPFGDIEADHFDSKEAARAAFEAMHSNISTSVKKDTRTPSEIAAAKRAEITAERQRKWPKAYRASGNASDSILQAAEPFMAKKVAIKTGPLTGTVFTVTGLSNRGFDGWHFEGRDETGTFRSTAMSNVTTDLNSVNPLPKLPKKAWESFQVPDAEDSKIISKPRENDPYGGYMGGRKWVGGKVPEDRYLSQKEAAAGIRADIKAAVKAGELPKDLSYSVRMNSGAWVTSVSIILGDKNDAGKPSEIHELDENNETLKDVKRYLEALGQQYASEDINSQYDYFNSSNSARVRYRSKWD